MRYVRLTLFAVLALVVTGSLVEAATITEIQFQGGTSGCFGPGCAAFTTPTSTALGGQTVTFTGASFDEMTDATGAASFGLGTFSRTGSFTSTFDDAPFTLRVTFVLPANIAGGQSTSLSALIDGTVTTGNSLMFVDFTANSTSFHFSNAFGEGSFDFLVYDPDSLNKNQNSRPLTGGIANAVFREYEVLPTPVPEPATLLLLGTGLSAVAVRVRRRRTR